MMTRKHFETIAAVICKERRIRREQHIKLVDNLSKNRPNFKKEAIKWSAQEQATADDAICHIAHKLANVFAEENPRFDRRRFYNACGGE